VRLEGPRVHVEKYEDTRRDRACATELQFKYVNVTPRGVSEAVKDHNSPAIWHEIGLIRGL